MSKKTIAILFVCLFMVFTTKGQAIINQINSDEFGEFSTAESLQVNSLSISSITQVGNNNSAKLSQTREGNLYSLSNSAHSFQQGDFNLFDITQKGNEHVLLSFQLGYLISGTYSIGSNQLNVPSQNLLSFTTTTNNKFTAGTNNALYSIQEGKSNNILSIQQGNDNYLDLEQSGNDNFLVVQQVGNSNRVEDFKQASIEGSFDIITQVGDNNTFSMMNESIGGLSENSYTQEGSNLSLTINNSFLSQGGITVNQTGRDMNIVIDQSYFTSPMQ